MAVGGHHSLVLLAVRRPASENFATRVRAVVKGGSWQDFNLVPCVYAWGWGDRGQLGESQTPREQGMTCVGPLKFVDRVFRDTVDLETGRPAECWPFGDMCKHLAAKCIQTRHIYRYTILRV